MQPECSALNPRVQIAVQECGCQLIIDLLYSSGYVA